MREIEYRGKSTHNGEWHYGWLTYSKLHNAYEITCGNGVYNFVDPETVGQYTGIKDKNGTKIFEGDIVHVNGFYLKETKYTDFNYSVEYRDGCFILTKQSKGMKLNLVMYALNSEVIGNIYDNPELLEVK